VTTRQRLIDWIAAIVFLLVPALVLRSSLRRGEPGVFDKAVLRVTAPLSAGVSWVVDKAGGAWNGYVALVDVESENAELRVENERLRKQLAAMARRAYDVEDLEQLAELKKRTESDTLGARVIGAPLSPFFRVMRIRIDRGEHEVASGMPVITSAGLVGRVDAAYGDYADVMLISDPGSSVEVVLQRTGARGILTGLGRGDAYTCTLQWLEQPSGPEVDVVARVGDKLVTSGLGPEFPAGIDVGTVSKVDAHHGIFQDVEVDPAVDMAQVRAVMVLLAPPPPPDPRGGKARKSAPAYGTRPY